MAAPAHHTTVLTQLYFTTASWHRRRRCRIVSSPSHILWGRIVRPRRARTNFTGWQARFPQGAKLVSDRLWRKRSPSVTTNTKYLLATTSLLKKKRYNGGGTIFQSELTRVLGSWLTTSATKKPMFNWTLLSWGALSSLLLEAKLIVKSDRYCFWSSEVIAYFNSFLWWSSVVAFLCENL